MRARVLVLAFALLAGCGSESDEQQITKLMSTLRATQDSGDAGKACEEVYVVQERGREPEGEGDGDGEAEGEGEGERARCEPAFERSVEQRKAAVKRLKTRLVRVDVDGEEATAVLHWSATRTDGTTFERDVPYALVHTDAGWRVRISPEG
jgi:hypothetical protein